MLNRRNTRKIGADYKGYRRILSDSKVHAVEFSVGIRQDSCHEFQVINIYTAISKAQLTQLRNCMQLA